MISLISIVVGLLSLQFAHGAIDPCTTLSNVIKTGGNAALNSQYAACIASFPYNATAGKSTIDTLQKTLPFYPFLDQAIKNPSPFLPGGVDLRKGLATIKATPWKTEFDFNKAIITLFNSLNVGHTQYQSSCFQFFPIALAFKFTKYFVASERKEVVFLAPNMGVPSDNVVNKATEKILKLKLKDYANAKVVAIEGKDPLSFITDWANANGGKYRDLNARVNSAFSRPVFDNSGSNTTLPGDFSFRALPQATDYLQISLQRSGSAKVITVKAPWIVDMSYALPFASGNEFQKHYCKDNSFADIRSIQQRGSSSEQKQAAPLATPSPGITAFYGNSLDLFILSDKTTAVFVIPTFAGRGPTFWMLDFKTALETLKKYKVKRLILDFSNNVDGLDELALHLLQTFFPGTFFSYPLQLAAPPLAQAMVTKNQRARISYSNYDYRDYADVSGQNFTAASQFFFPVSNTVTNLQTNAFSKRMTMAAAKTPPASAPLFPVKNLLVLTNGICTGQCATVTYSLYERLKVKHVVTGGNLNKPMAFAGQFAGSIMTAQQLIISNINALGFENDARAPKDFPVSSAQNFFFPLVQYFSLNSSTVAGDFVFLPAHVHIPYTASTVWSFPNLWQQVATYF